MPSRSRLEGAVRLARAYVDSDRATFAERELAWAVLRLAGSQASVSAGVPAATVSLLHQNGAGASKG